MDHSGLWRLEAEPDNAAALSSKTAALIMLGRHEDALACIERILRTDPGNLPALNAKSASLLSLAGATRPPDASTRYLQGIRTTPPRWAKRPPYLPGRTGRGRSTAGSRAPRT
ncbi:MAG: hypothetical protein MPJ06_08665 [Nitrosopumilus sp.]|nr:hypothetical protein [Nitrosopumilus sp.]MDA7944052.1 hypothetical protein [Nitrosopumilus sp.]